MILPAGFLNKQNYSVSHVQHCAVPLLQVTVDKGYRDFLHLYWCCSRSKVFHQAPEPIIMKKYKSLKMRTKVCNAHLWWCRYALKSSLVIQTVKYTFQSIQNIMLQLWKKRNIAWRWVACVCSMNVPCHVCFGMKTLLPFFIDNSWSV